jgi:uncharacterized LabA/DUF88 family protein
MIHNYARGTACIFIDASNIYYSFKQLGWKIDFVKLKDYFKYNVQQLVGIYYYSAYDPDYPKQSKFLDFLEMIGYTVRKKKVKFIKDSNLEDGGFHKGNLDVELTIDAVHNRDNF